ncbi:hypothetical protein [Massilia sp. LC238]|uniref:hypothetical protein n=1 Tax=Massilia sp. LC238 TaxID=1502852 RepID=UPI0004E38E99|nr:hypothetical protein [Massilia sp. LC238]KFC61924.1 hypothetical protein FG94_04964 [Massilia sp. LC238]
MANKTTLKTWRERIGARPDFPLHAPTDVERAMEAEIAELRASIEDVRRVGALMANTMFNLGQKAGTVVDQRLADSMREMQRAWDVAVRTAPRAVQQAACTCPSGDGSLRWPCPAHSPACVLTLPVAIMNLPCKPRRAIALHGASKQAYQEGHRDARHAAADLVLERADELAALAVPHSQATREIGNEA